ncbi:MAG: hypothetical protein ACFFFK_01345 [Candidatus Thorarchaeota archaeon]
MSVDLIGANLKVIWCSMNSMQHDNKRTIKGTNVSSINLEDMIISTLSRLDIVQTSIRKIDLAPLETCKNLEILMIQDNSELCEIDLSAISHLENLHSLAVSGCKIDELDLTPISSLKKLIYLDISKNRLSYVDLKPVTLCPSLQDIHLEKNPLNLERLKMREIHKLQDLRLFSVRGVTDLTNFEQTFDLTGLIYCEKLEELRIDEDVYLIYSYLAKDKEWPKGLLKYEHEALMTY